MAIKNKNVVERFLYSLKNAFMAMSIKTLKDENFKDVYAGFSGVLDEIIYHVDIIVSSNNDDYGHVLGSTSEEVKIGQSLVTTISAVAESGYSFVKWQQSTDGTTWTDMIGSASTTVTISTAGVYYYKAVFAVATYHVEIVTSANDSSYGDISINSASGPSSLSQDVTVGQSLMISLYAKPNSGYSFANWQQSTDGTTWTDMAGGEVKNLTISSAGTYYYKAIFEEAVPQLVQLSLSFYSNGGEVPVDDYTWRDFSMSINNNAEEVSIDNGWSFESGWSVATKSFPVGSKISGIHFPHTIQNYTLFETCITPETGASPYVMTEDTYCVGEYMMGG